MTDLFEIPIVHSNDPVSSQEAGERMTKSGARQRNADVVYALVAANPGSTSGELSSTYDSDPRWSGASMPAINLTELRRRLTDLSHAGRVVMGATRKCRVQGTTQSTWTVVASEVPA